MDKYEYNKENFNNVDGNYIHPTEIKDVLLTLSGVDEDEKLEDGVYDLYATCQNEHNRDSYRVFYKALAIITDKMQNDSPFRSELSKRIEFILGNSFYSADEIDNDILIDPCYVIERLIEYIEEKGE